MKEVLDCMGLRCPQPVLKLAIRAATVNRGTTIELRGDCPTLAQDVAKWCQDTGTVLINTVSDGAVTTATIQF